jgi:hypothetical protein
MSGGSSCSVEFGGVDENTIFIPFSGVPLCSLYQFFLRVSSDIGGEIQKLMVVSNCIV